MAYILPLAKIHLSKKIEKMKKMELIDVHLKKHFRVLFLRAKKSFKNLIFNFIVTHFNFIIHSCNESALNHHKAVCCDKVSEMDDMEV